MFTSLLNHILNFPVIISPSATFFTLSKSGCSKVLPIFLRNPHPKVGRALEDKKAILTFC